MYVRSSLASSSRSCWRFADSCVDPVGRLALAVSTAARSYASFSSSGESVDAAVAFGLLEMGGALLSALAKAFARA